MMDIKNKIIDICVHIMDILDDKRLGIFLIAFAQFDKKLTVPHNKYLQLQMKVNQAGSTKPFEKSLSQMQSVKQEFNDELN